MYLAFSVQPDQSVPESVGFVEFAGVALRTQLADGGARRQIRRNPSALAEVCGEASAPLLRSYAAGQPVTADLWRADALAGPIWLLLDRPSGEVLASGVARSKVLAEAQRVAAGRPPAELAPVAKVAPAPVVKLAPVASPAAPKVAPAPASRPAARRKRESWEWVPPKAPSVPRGLEDGAAPVWRKGPTRERRDVITLARWARAQVSNGHPADRAAWQAMADELAEHIAAHPHLSGETKLW